MIVMHGGIIAISQTMSECPLPACLITYFLKSLCKVYVQQVPPGVFNKLGVGYSYRVT